MSQQSQNTKRHSPSPSSRHIAPPATHKGKINVQKTGRELMKSHSRHQQSANFTKGASGSMVKQGVQPRIADESFHLQFNSFPVEFRSMFRDGNPDELANGITLQFDSWFGYENSKYKHSAHFVSDQSILLKSGKHFVVMNQQKKSFSFVKRNTPGNPITCLAHGYTRRKELLIAFSQNQNANTPILYIIKVGKDKALEMPHEFPSFTISNSVLNSTHHRADNSSRSVSVNEHLNNSTLHSNNNWEISQIFIQEMGKYAITLAKLKQPDAPTTTNSIVSYWNYQKEKLFIRGQFKYHFIKIAVSPVNYNQFVGAGKGLLRSFQANEKTIVEATTKLLSTKIERQNDFIDTSFIPGSQVIVAISTQNNIVIIQNNSLKHYGKIHHQLRDDLFRYIQPSQDPDPLQQQKGVSIFEQSDPKCSTSGLTPQLQKVTSNSINNSLAVFPKGVVVGTKNLGLLSFYEFQKDYRISKIDTFPCPDAQFLSEIESLNLSRDYKYLLINARLPMMQRLNAEQQSSVNARQWKMVSNCQWGENASRVRLELYILDMRQFKTFVNSFTTPINRLLGSKARNPLGKILSISMPIVKGVILTGGEDQYIRLWKYEGNIPRQIQSFQCHDVPLAVAIHPFGFQAVAGFRDSLRAYFILQEEIHQCYEYQGRPCQSVTFSRGGHYIAAGNGPCITIFDSINMQILYQLLEHPGTVQGIKFSQNDQYLTSYCNNSICYVWSVDFDQYDSHIPTLASKGGVHHQSKRQGLPGYGRQLQYIVKPQKISAFDYDDEYDLMVIATSSDHTMKIVSKRGRQHYIDIKFRPQCYVTTIDISKRQQVILLGMSDGSIKVLLWPILSLSSMRGQTNTVNIQSLESLQFRSHDGAITSTALSYDTQTFASSSEDGTIYLHTIKDVSGVFDNSLDSNFLGTGNESNNRKIYPYNNVYEYGNLREIGFVFRTDMQQKREQIRALNKKILVERNEAQKRQQNTEDSFKSLLKLREKQASLALEQEKKNTDKLSTEFESQKRLLLNTIEKNLTEHKLEKEKREIEMQNKLMSAMDQVQQLQQDLDTQKLSHKTEVQNILLEQRQAFDTLEDQYLTQIQELSAIHAKLLNQVKDSDTKFESALQQFQNQYEVQVAKSRLQFLGKYRGLAEKNDQLKAGKELEKRRVVKLDKKIGALEDRLNLNTKAQLEIKSKCDDRDKKLIQMEEQLAEREQIIRSKEQSIKQLRQFNMQLENFRFILDQKLLTMQSEKQPMQEQIRNLQEHIKKMFQQMVEATQQRQKLQKDLNYKDGKVKAVNSALDLKSQALRAFRYKFDSLLNDISVLLSHYKDSNDIALRLSQIYRKYSQQNIQQNITKNQLSKQPVWGTKSPKSQKSDDLSQMEEQEKFQQKARSFKNFGERDKSPVLQQLQRQRDWLDKKLQSVVDRHKKKDTQKDERIQRIYRQNRKLIQECNVLRYDNQTIAKKVIQLQKRLRMITGAKNNNTSFDMDDMDNLSSPGAARLRRAKIESQKKQIQQQQYMPFLQRIDQRKMSMPNHDELRGMISDIQRNKEVIQGQGQQMVKLHKKMNQFLSGSQMIDQVEEMKEATLQQNQETLNNNFSQRVPQNLPSINQINTSAVKRQINPPVGGPASGGVSYSQQSMLMLSNQYSISPSALPQQSQKFFIGHESSKDDEVKIQESVALQQANQNMIQSQQQYMLVENQGPKTKQGGAKKMEKLHAKTKRTVRNQQQSPLRKMQIQNPSNDEQKLKGRLTPSLLSPQGRRSSQQQQNILLPNLKKRQSSSGFQRKSSVPSISDNLSPTAGGGFAGLKKAASHATLKRGIPQKKEN